MSEQISRRSLMKRTLYAGLAIGGISALGISAYSVLRKKPIDELCGPYPDSSRLKPLTISNPAAEKPNVIVIYCDDLGYGDLGCYGSKSISTPNIDQLARDGMKFTDYYACSAVCGPSRAGLLTGRYPLRSGIIGNAYPSDEPQTARLVRKLANGFSLIGAADLHEDYFTEGLSNKETTIATALKVAGYRTAMIGKWHLGDYSKQAEFNPLRHGFDRYLGVPHSNDMHPCPLFRNEQQLEADIGNILPKLTGMYTDEALDFIEKSKDGPFFLYLAHTFPHQPLAASERFAGKSKAGKFGDAVEEIDWSVGEIVKGLRKNGIERNTLIIFTSDNGPWYEGSAKEFRGRKGQSYEGGFRVPFIAKWPGHIRPGSASAEAVSNLDIFPTVLHLAGIEAPSDRIIDGRNIHDLLSGRNPKSPHDALYFYHYGRLEGVRVGTWKYFRELNRYVWPVPLDAEQLPRELSKKSLGNRAPLLYNLALDPGESYNVIDTHPDVARKLAGMLAQWEQVTNSNPRGFTV